MAKAAKIKYSAAGVTVQGNLSVTGTATITGSLSYTNLTLTGNFQVDGNTVIGSAVGDTCRFKATTDFDEETTFDKNIKVGTGVAVTAGGLQITAGGELISAGNLVLTAGDIVLDVGDVALTAGDVEVDAGDIAVTLGDIVVAAGDIEATLGSITAGSTITGKALVTTLTVDVGTDLTVDGNTTLGNAIGDTTTMSGSASVGGNLGVTGTLTAGALVVAGLFTADDFTVTDDLQVGDDALVSGDLTVTGAAQFNGTVGLGNAAGDTVTITGQVAGDIEFTGAAQHNLIGEADQNLSVKAAGTGHLFLGTNADENAIEIENGGAILFRQAATFDSTVMVDGVMTFSANPVFDIAGACSITATAGQDMNLIASGAGEVHLEASNSLIAVHDGAGGNIDLNAGAGTVGVTGILSCSLAFNPGTDITFVGAAAHALSGVADQALHIHSLGTGELLISSVTGDLTLQTAGAVGALVVSGGADLITLGSPLTTTETIAKTGTANGGAVVIRVAEGVHDPFAAAATSDIIGAIPAGALVLGVVVRVLEEITFAGGGAAYDVGIVGATTLWGEDEDPTVGHPTTGENFLGGVSPLYFPAATNIRLSADAGTFTGGAGAGELRWKVFYIDFTAIAS